MAEHYRNRSLLGMTGADVEPMRELGETLFVELKSGGDDSGHYRLSQAIAAFANTLGGWLLIGLNQTGEQVAPPPQWIVEAGPQLVDAIRDRVRGHLDPLPAFEARTFDLAGGPVGVVRVYESTDTPVVHIDSGAICIREPAGERDAQRAGGPGATAATRRRFAVGQVRNQIEVIELARKGERARARADGLLKPHALPIVVDDLGLRFSQAAGGKLEVHPDIGPSVFVELAPLSPPARFAAWSVSEGAVETGKERLATLAATEAKEVGVEPRAHGVVLRTHLGDQALVRGVDGDKFGGSVTLIADGAGLVGARFSIRRSEDRENARYTPERLAKQLLEPTLTALCGWLKDREILGRALTHLWFVRLSETITLEVGGSFQRQTPAGTPAGTSQLSRSSPRRRSAPSPSAPPRSSPGPADSKSGAELVISPAFENRMGTGGWLGEARRSARQPSLPFPRERSNPYGAAG